MFGDTARCPDLTKSRSQIVSKIWGTRKLNRRSLDGHCVENLGLLNLEDSIRNLTVDFGFYGHKANVVREHR